MKGTSSKLTSTKPGKSRTKRTSSQPNKKQKKRPLSNNDRKKAHSSGRQKGKDQDSLVITPNQRPASKGKKNSRTQSLRDNSFSSMSGPDKSFKRSVINNFLSNTQILTGSFKAQDLTSFQNKPQTSFQKFLK